MTDPGHRVLPGDGPLLPPMPLPPELPADDEGCDCDQKASILPHRMSCHVVTSQSGSSEDEVPYDYPGDARHAAADALIAAGLVDPDDGTVPRWRRGDPTPVWTNPMHVVDTVLKAALPHLRAFQIETQVRVGYELGRREAGEQIAGAIENNHGWQTPDQQKALDLAAHIAREVTKGDPNG